jgi:ribulose-5-phosphate 4-epimerase/fuculose-1-phosphate aldolase
MHRRLPQARVVMHLHPPFATTIAALADPMIKPIDQNTARYFNRLAVDDSYTGMADSEQEGARLARLLGNKSRLMMGNHGVLVIAGSVGEAFDDIYTIERACQTLVQAYSTGQPLKVLPDEVAENTAQDWEKIVDFSVAHFDEMKRVLDAEDPSYAH